MRKRYPPKLKVEIVLEIVSEQKSMAQIASARGVHPNQLSKWKHEALQGLPSLFEPEHEKTRALQQTHQRQLDELYAEIGRLTTQVNWLKKNLVSTLPRAERLAMVERDSAELSLKTQAELLSLSLRACTTNRCRPRLKRSRSSIASTNCTPRTHSMAHVG